MLAFTGQLSDDYEYGIVWWGQSNARPWGDRDNEGYVASPHLKLAQAGQDLTFLRIEGFPATNGPTSNPYGLAGTKSTLTVAEVLVADHYVGAELRFVQAETGDTTFSTKLAGVGKVISNTTSQLVVEWTTGIESPNRTTPIVWERTGYVHLQDKWKSYATVRTLTAYQPEQPGDYPTTAVMVPGYTVPSSVTGYSDTGLFLPLAWDEGVEGAGLYGDGSTESVDVGSSTALTLAGSATLGIADLYVGAKILLRKLGQTYIGTVTANSNTTSITTSSTWTPSAPPVTTGYEYELALPHWKNNPYWASPGFGFRYPNNDMLPCSQPNASGNVYNRPRARFVPSYKSFVLDAGNIATNWNNSGLAQCTSGGIAGSFAARLYIDTVPAPDVAYLRITRTDVGLDPATGRIQMELFVRPGNIVNLAGWTSAPGSVTLTGNWRCAKLRPAAQIIAGIASTSFDAGADTVTLSAGEYAAISVGDPVSFSGAGVPTGITPGATYYVATKAGSDKITLESWVNGAAVPVNITAQAPSGTATMISLGYIDLVAYLGAPLYSGDPAFPLLPPASVINATAGANAWVTRMVVKTYHRFGALIEYAWRVSSMIGKRVNLIHLGVNSSAQILRATQNYFGFKGQIGWWDYNKYLDWTPGNPDGNATRLRSMITKMAPAALQAEGNTKPLKILGIVGFQGEGDAIVEAGREMYSKTLNTFYGWLRNLIQSSGLSYYSSAKRIPVVHASLPKIPWEIDSFSGYGGALNGDTQGLVNSAIADFAAKDGFAATFDTNASPKLNNAVFGNDPLHFNGVGEARNGELAADAWVAAANRAVPNNGDAKVVQICNLALSHIGEHAGITSIDPPDGSVLAAHCAKFYPIARDSLLEMKQWSFTSKRVALTSVVNSWSEWDYSYAIPGDVLNVVSVLPPDAQDDYSTRFSPTDYQVSPQIVAAGQYVPQPYAIETDVNGNKVLYSDQKEAVLRYNAYITDSNQFPPQFVIALSWHLASMLAGPVLKGEVGAAEAKRCQAMMAAYLGRAESADANQRSIKPEQITPWMSNR